MAKAIVFNDGDHAEDRPVVIVIAPRERTGYVTVLERTSSRFDLPGVAHAASTELGLERNGKWVFEWQRSILGSAFTDSAFELRGSLPESELDLLIEDWERQS